MSTCLLVPQNEQATFGVLASLKLRQVVLLTLCNGIDCALLIIRDAKTIYYNPQSRCIYCDCTTRRKNMIVNQGIEIEEKQDTMLGATL